MVVAAPCAGSSEPSRSAVTEALKRHWPRFLSRFGLDPARTHVLNNLFACRTPAMGAHLCVCGHCGFSEQVNNSCRNRHCPQCQGQASAEWLEKRVQKMLPVPHFQVVFTLPSQLRAVAFDNQALVYGLMMRSSASVLADLAKQRLKARLGVTTVLHTWTSELTYHPHIHCLVSAGGLSLEAQPSWVATGGKFLFPQKVMGAMFRGRFLQGLIEAFIRGEIDLRGDDTALAITQFDTLLRRMARRHKRWVVHVEPPGDRPVSHIVKYLARYVKRVAISDARIVKVTEDAVLFKTKRGLCVLDGAEFVRRFTLHILPKGFRKVRHQGLYAPGSMSRLLELARSLAPPEEQRGADPTASPAAAEETHTTSQSRGVKCRRCGAAELMRSLIRRPAFRARGPP